MSSVRRPPVKHCRGGRLDITRRLLMKIKKNLLPVALAATTLCAATAAFAGPPVRVTFKNLGRHVATYKVVTPNEALTHAHATDKPDAVVAAGGSDTYLVQIPISPDANAANVRYTMGTKTCEFMTTFINQIAAGGLFPGGPTKVPKWNKNSTSSGGAICNATLKSQNFSDFSWAVEFTMK